MTNFQKAKMLLQFAGEMLLRNRPHIANWATKESEKYLDLHEKGETK
ncbi:hypothetical protein [Niallia sp. FSL R7-0271]